MNPNPQAYRILCFGDSNTWGEVPDGTRSRWPSNVRWTGKLQELLGNDYSIIEEGLQSRTTDLDYPDRPGRNGRAWLVPCLATHRPLDAVVLVLGTNDLKIEFDRSIDEVASALSKLIDDIHTFITEKQSDQPLRIILVSPARINEHAPLFEQMCSGYFDHTSVKKAEQLATALQAVARAKGCDFIDASQYVRPGRDGLHWEAERHEAFAKAVARMWSK